MFLNQTGFGTPPILLLLCFLVAFIALPIGISHGEKLTAQLMIPLALILIPIILMGILEDGLLRFLGGLILLEVIGALIYGKYAGWDLFQSMSESHPILYWGLIGSLIILLGWIVFPFIEIALERKTEKKGNGST